MTNNNQFLIKNIKDIKDIKDMLKIAIIAVDIFERTGRVDNFEDVKIVLSTVINILKLSQSEMNSTYGIVDIEDVSNCLDYNDVVNLYISYII
jgi:hypothetical protein